MFVAFETSVCATFAVLDDGGGVPCVNPVKLVSVCFFVNVSELFYCNCVHGESIALWCLYTVSSETFSGLWLSMNGNG